MTSTSPATVFDHAADLALVVDEPEQVSRTSWRERATSCARRTRRADDRVLPPPAVAVRSGGRGDRGHARASARLPRARRRGGSATASSSVAWPSRRRALVRGTHRRDFAAALKAADRRRGERVLCVTARPGKRGAARGDSRGPTSSPRRFAVAGLREGFEFPEQKLTVYSEREIFGEDKHAPERKSKSRAAFLSDFRDLQGRRPGRPRRSRRRAVRGPRASEGRERQPRFHDPGVPGGRPAVRAHRPARPRPEVQRRRGAPAARSTSSGGVGWEKVKSRVRKSVESMAKELLELYARRRAATGHAFAADGPWQAELEAAFPFELTADQERAVREVKDDLEQPKPMDRLLVGDVGFGKTEVAVRAAFKVGHGRKAGRAPGARRRCWRRSTSRRSRSDSPRSR